MLHELRFLKLPISGNVLLVRREIAAKTWAQFVVAEMVTFLITSFFIISLLAVAVYFWQKPAVKSEPQRLPPEPTPRSLFTSDAPEPLARSEAELLSEIVRAKVLARARASEKTALKEAQDSKDPKLYQETLDLLAAAAQGPQLLSLVSYVCRNNLPVNITLAEKFVELWKGSPLRNTIGEMLHVAALSNDARTYDHAVEVALDCWRDGRLSILSPAELRAIIDGEFWILSSTERSSGAGFSLKQTLASARRELEAARLQDRAQ